MKKILIVAALFIAQFGFGQNISGYFNDIAKGDISKMSQKFSPTMEICVNDTQDFMSKSEAVASLKSFLTQVKPISAEELHSGSNKSGAKYSVGKLKTEKGSYRVFINVENSGSDYEIVSVVFNPE